MFINETDKQRIIEAAEGRLLDVIKENSSIARRGQTYKGKCPACGEENKFEFSPKKNIFKCWSCDFSGNSPVSFWMKQGKTFPESLKLLANQFNIAINPPEEDTPKSRKGNTKTYC